MNCPFVSCSVRGTEKVVVLHVFRRATTFFVPCGGAVRTRNEFGQRRFLPGPQSLHIRTSATTNVAGVRCVAGHALLEVFGERVAQGSLRMLPATSTSPSSLQVRSNLLKKNWLDRRRTCGPPRAVDLIDTSDVLQRRGKGAFDARTDHVLARATGLDTQPRGHI